MKPTHILRYGVHTEQQFFLNNKDKYDQILFNANMVAYSSTGLASLMFGSLNDKPYLIDPNTHIFAHATRYIKSPPNDEGVVKSSIASLGGIYGDLTNNALLHDRPVVANDFVNSRTYHEFALKVLEFQMTGLSSALEPSDSKYLVFDASKVISPTFLIAPYFFLEREGITDWLPINIELFKHSVGLFPEKPLFAELLIDWGVLENEESVKSIADQYLSLNGVSGFVIWISNFPESEAAVSTLRGLKLLVQELSKKKYPLINLYGGYYSLLLTKHGMTGVAHGPGYGEDRNVIPVGGGMPASKFYLTPTHQRLLFRDVQFMVNANVWKDESDFYSSVCDGQTCKETLGTNLKENFIEFGKEIIRTSKGKEYSFPTPRARLLTTNHYLEAKAHEYEQISKFELPDL